MDAAGGFELAALAAKVDELSRVCARLGQENAELRDQVSRLSAGASRSARRPGGIAAGGTAGGPAQA